MATNRVRQLARELPRHKNIMGKAMRAAGYSDSYSLNPHRVKKTKGYKRVMEPILTRLERLRADTIKALEGKDPSQEEYKTLVIALGEYTKQIQLLSWKPTDITSEVARQMTEAELEAKEKELEEIINGPNDNGTEEVGTPSTGEAKEGESQEEAN